MYELRNTLPVVSSIVDSKQSKWPSVVLFQFDKLLYVGKCPELVNSSQVRYHSNATLHSHAWVHLGFIIWHSCFALNRQNMSNVRESCLIDDITLEMLHQALWLSLFNKFQHKPYKETLLFKVLTASSYYLSQCHSSWLYIIIKRLVNNIQAVSVMLIDFFTRLINAPKWMQLTQYHQTQ